MSEISMNLVIQAHTFKNELLAKTLSGQFDSSGGTIGRAPTNTLCLPDPERHISRLHAEIFFRNGEFRIRNVGSSNPIIINGRVILPNEEAPLNGTDDIAMGSYSLRVALNTENTVGQNNLQAQAVSHNRMAIVPSTAHAEEINPHQEQEPSFAGAPTAPMPLSIPVPEPEPAIPAITPIHLNLEDAPQAQAPETQKPTPQQVAAFSDLLGDTSSPAASSIPPQATPNAQPTTPPSRPWYKFGATTAAPVSADLPQAQLSEPAQTPRPQGILRPAHQMAETTMPAVRVSREAPFTINPPKPMPPIPGPGGAIVNNPIVTKAPATPPVIATEPTPPQQRPTPQNPTPQSAAPNSTQANHSEVLWNAFCEGAGISIHLPQGLNPELMHMLGQILNQSIGGTLKLVAMRTAAKQELRAQVTTIQSRNNNPLKFSPNAAAAIEQLLQPPARGFMVGPAAVADAMDDLLGHANGTMGGMRAALAGALQRFEPKRLESKLTHQSMLDTLLPMNRRAKLWELYLEHFQRIQNEAEEDFHELFGKAFLKAYDEQINRLHNERSTPTTP
jgi:FHA domain-containing protein